MKHAVVIGGSMAGVLTAVALSNHFDRVTIVERDRFPAAPEPRKGVPQARHLHAFWAGGLQAVDRMLPGIEADLLAAGGISLSLPTDMVWLMASDRWCTRFPASQHVVSASRSLIDWVVRRRVEQVDSISFLTGHDVTGLRLDQHGDVRGVTVVSRDDRTVAELGADLVVDAGGRGSGLPDWLAALGRTRPRETVVDASLGYSTRRFAIPAGLEADWKTIYVQAAPPRHVRAGIMFPIENGEWIATVMGGGGDHPPTDEDGYLEFARSLRHPILYDAIRAAEPVSPVFGYRRTANRRRHYEDLRDLPGRLLVIGDSLCAFNPVYGQGMTVAAKQAEALDLALRTAAGPRTVQRAIVKPAESAWMLSTGEDLRYPTTQGARVTPATRLTHRYMSRVLRAAAVDPSVNAAFLRVLNMIDPPQALFGPRVMARALAPSRRSPEAAPPTHRPLDVAVSYAGPPVVR
jgi:2-polyprenyl-6-methoxyphenol hydroxylase-like FAD-dependent oxidoreductase